MPRRKADDHEVIAEPDVIVAVSDAPAPVSDGLVEVHLCGPSREFLEAIRLEPDRRRHGLAWNGHHYAHFDTVGDGVWRYCQVD